MSGDCRFAAVLIEHHPAGLDDECPSTLPALARSAEQPGAWSAQPVEPSPAATDEDLDPVYQPD